MITCIMSVDNVQVSSTEWDGYELWSIAEVKEYWMRTMAIDETREQMEEFWSTEIGQIDLMNWLEAEIDLGLTYEEMVSSSTTVANW